MVARLVGRHLFVFLIVFIFIIVFVFALVYCILYWGGLALGGY